MGETGSVSTPSFHDLNVIIAARFDLPKLRELYEQNPDDEEVKAEYTSRLINAANAESRAKDVVKDILTTGAAPADIYAVLRFEHRATQADVLRKVRVILKAADYFKPEDLDLRNANDVRTCQFMNRSVLYGVVNPELPPL